MRGLALVCAAASAAPAAAANFAGGVGLATDRVYRGLSQSDGEPSAALDLSWAFEPGLALAAGASGPAYRWLGGDGEWHVAASKAWFADQGAAYELALAHYEYPGQPRARQYRYTELRLATAWDAGAARWTAALALAPRYGAFIDPGPRGFYSVGRGANLELSASFGLGGAASVDLGAGWQQLWVARRTGYAYGSAGLSWQAGAWRWGLTAIGSQARQRRVAADARNGTRWVGSVVVGF
jgi:uncharacterized protein (TIGR02001 family)